MFEFSILKFLSSIKSALVHIVLGVMLLAIGYQYYTISKQGDEITSLQEKLQSANFDILNGTLNCNVEKRTSNTVGIGISLSDIIKNEFGTQVEATTQKATPSKNNSSGKKTAVKKKSDSTPPVSLSDVKPLDTPSTLTVEPKSPSRQISMETTAKLQRYAAAHDAFIDTF